MFNSVRAIAPKTIFMTIALLMAITSSGWGQTSCGGTTTWALTAGQTINVGSVTVCNDATNLYVTYKLTYPGATFGTLQVWAGSDLLNLPANNNGTPIPGQFCSADGGACFDATGLTEYTFVMPLAGLSIPDVTKMCGASLNVATHAEVTMDSNNDGTMDHETAFGGPTAGGGPRWWFYGTYSLSCDFGAPLIPVSKTAFAKCAAPAAGHVLTTDPKSNPEKLPSLNLIKNRWGWAANLPLPGIYTCDLWAGAGLNKTSNGTKVGTVTFDWNGSTSTVSVAYNLFSGFALEEVHLYAQDGKPTTAAPGQYGYLSSWDPGISSFTFSNVPLADADGIPGVWVIAHAVVSSTSW